MQNGTYLKATSAIFVIDLLKKFDTIFTFWFHYKLLQSKNQNDTGLGKLSVISDIYHL